MSTNIFKKALLGAALVGGVAAMAPAQIPVPPLPPGLNVRITTGNPPPIRHERRVARPGPDYVWVGGYWADNGGHWDWIPGRWERPVERNAYWIPARYIHTSHGTIYEPAHWSTQQVVVDESVRNNRYWRAHEREHQREIERERHREHYDHDRDHDHDHR